MLSASNLYHSEFIRQQEQPPSAETCTSAVWILSASQGKGFHFYKRALVITHSSTNKKYAQVLRQREVKLRKLNVDARKNIGKSSFLDMKDSKERGHLYSPLP